MRNRVFDARKLKQRNILSKCTVHNLLRNFTRSALSIGNAAVLAVLLEASVANPRDEWLQDAVHV